MTGRRLWADRSGAVAVLFSLCSSILFVCAALAIDFIMVFTSKRAVQGAADLAAILAADDPSRAAAVVRRSLADNGFADEAASAVVTLGQFRADASYAIADRFATGATPWNAVQVSFSKTVQTPFARVIGLPSTFVVKGVGTATTARYGSFAIGSQLAALDGGIANSILGAIAGQRLTLRVADYDALAQVDLDSFRLLDALAVRLGLTVGDYDNVLKSQASIGQLLSALSVTIPGGSATTAIARLLDDLRLSTGKVVLGQIIDLGEPTARRSAAPEGPTVPLMPMLVHALSIANGTSQASVDLGGTVAGIAGVKILIAIGERMQHSGFQRPTSSGATVRTAQIRILIEAGVTTPLGGLSVPVYVEAAYGQAKLTAVNCPWTDQGRRDVTIEAKPAVIDLAIALVPKSAIAAGAPAPDLAIPAPIASLPLLTVRANARAGWEADSPRSMTFTDDDIRAKRRRTVSSTRPVTSLTGSLLSSIRLDVNGISFRGLLGLQPILRDALDGLASPLDRVLDSTLQALGIRVGSLDVVAGPMRCDRGVLVQ